jgi:hypothetical protein
VHVGICGLEVVVQIAARFLAGTDDDVVYLQYLWIPIDDDMQPGVVDALVVHSTEHLHVLHLQRGAMHPAGGLVEALARGAGSPLQEPYFARRRFGHRLGQATAICVVLVYAPPGDRAAMRWSA